MKKVLAFILIYILSKGIPYLSPSLFSIEYTSENVTMLPTLQNGLFFQSQGYTKTKI